MSTVKTNNVQIGQSLTATNNFTLYQPSSPDGTVRLGNGNSGSVSDVITVGTTGNLTFANSVSLSAASTKTLTLNGGAGSNGLVLDASNNVGIGTSSIGTGTKVEIRGANTITNARGVFAVNTTTAAAVDVGGSISLGGENGQATTPLLFGAIAGRYEGSGYAGYLQFSTISSGGTASEKMRLDSSGNLGLSVTPSGWSGVTAIELPAYGHVAAANTQLNFSVNAYYNGGYKYKNTGTASFFNANNNSFTWNLAPSGTAGNAISFTQAMTLDASGNLLVGTTSFNYAANGVGIRSNAYSYFTATSNPSILLNRKGTSGSLVSINYEDSGVGSISTNGTSTAYNTTSDQRLKTNIAPSGSAIQSILDFPVDQFDWISTGEHQAFGAVAQKIIQIIPEMVSVPEDPEEMMGVDWSKAVPRLIKAIQELSQELESLKQKVNA